PHRHVAQALRHCRIGIVLVLQAADRHRWPLRMQQAAAHRHQRGEAVGVAQRQVPGAVAAHRQAGEVGAVRVAVELARGRVELGQHHIGHLVPLRAFRRLREHHDRGELRGAAAHVGAESDLGLPAVVVAALARAVQEQDHRGPAVDHRARRREHLVAVRAAFDLDLPLQEHAARGQRGEAHAAAKHEDKEQRGRQAHDGSPVTVQRRMTSVASPRKLKNPMTSVTAVTTTGPGTAGSTPMRLSSSGTATPASAAEQKLMTSAEAITSDSSQLPNQASATSPTSPPISRPLINATRSSFHSRMLALLAPTWPRAMPRTIRVSTCTAALPPMPATIGISTASATICSMVASNWPITPAATNAVSRLMPSQTTRPRTARGTGENRS